MVSVLLIIVHCWNATFTPTNGAAPRAIQRLCKNVSIGVSRLSTDVFRHITAIQQINFTIHLKNCTVHILLVIQSERNLLALHQS